MIIFSVAISLQRIAIYSRYFGLYKTEFLKLFSAILQSSPLSFFFAFLYVFIMASFYSYIIVFFSLNLEPHGKSSYPPDSLATVVAETLGLCVQEESVSNCLVW